MRLRPSLDAAARALSAELPPGERVVEMLTDEDVGVIYVATNSRHEHGITVYGATDEPKRRAR